jgi:hypothetical protein
MSREEDSFFDVNQFIKTLENIGGGGGGRMPFFE